MGLEIPNLDKKDFETRLKEAMAKLPTYSKNWTEYNASDPGITIIELLAWIADINSYKLNRVRQEHYDALIKLLIEDSQEITIDSSSELQNEYFSMDKLVTLDDFESFLILDEQIKKVKASADKEQNLIKIIIVPNSYDEKPIPTKKLKKDIKKELDDRVLLTTKVELEDPSYHEVNLNIVLKTKLQNPNELRKQIISQLEKFLHPISGGIDKKGWDFGEDLHISDIYLLLSEIEGIDIIDSIFFNKEDTSFKLDSNSLPISGKHLVEVKIIPSNRSCL